MPYVGVINGETWMIAGFCSKYLEGEEVNNLVHMVDAQLKKIEFLDIICLFRKLGHLNIRL